MDRDAAPFFFSLRGSMARPRAVQQAPDSQHASSRAKRRRIAAALQARTSSVLVCESASADAPSLRSAIAALGFETIHCPTLDDCLRSTAASQPDVVIVVLPDCPDSSVSLLQLMRRASPSTPLVIVAHNATLETRARCQPLRPYYFAVPPIASDELRAVIHGAIESAAPRT